MLFSAELIDFKMVCNVLKSICLHEYVILRPTKEGLKLTLEDMKCTEISIYVPLDIFMSYQINTEDELVFKINLKILTDCLNIFGEDGNPSLKINYKSFEDPLCLVMKHLEENIIIDCELKTFTVDDFQNISLSDECNMNKIVLDAKLLEEILYRLDGCVDEVNIKIAPESPYLTLAAEGSMGKSVTTIDKCSEDVTVYECENTVHSQYLFSHLKQLLKVLHYASKIYISMGNNGLLNIQLVIFCEEKEFFLDYYVTSIATEY